MSALFASERIDPTFSGGCAFSLLGNVFVKGESEA
jgi:hypothetical protein